MKHKESEFGFWVIQYNYKTEKDLFRHFPTFEDAEKFVFGANREDYAYTIAEILGKY